jgi:hypothetical protein
MRGAAVASLIPHINPSFPALFKSAKNLQDIKGKDKEILDPLVLTLYQVSPHL